MNLVVLYSISNLLLSFGLLQPWYLNGDIWLNPPQQLKFARYTETALETAASMKRLSEWRWYLLAAAKWQNAYAYSLFRVCCESKSETLSTSFVLLSILKQPLYAACSSASGKWQFQAATVYWTAKFKTIRLNSLCRRIIMACTLFPEFICRSPLSGSFALLSLDKQWLLQTPLHHTVRQSQRTWALIQVHNIRRNLYQRTWTTKLFFHVQLLTWHMYDTLLDKTLLGQRLSRASIHAALQWSTPCPTAQKGRLLSTSPRR